MGLQDEAPKSTEKDEGIKEVKVRVTMWETVEMDMPTALQFPLINEKVREALKEFYEWYDVKYAMPVIVTFNCDQVGLIIEYNIEQEVNECIDTCIKLGQENGLDRADIGSSCAEECYDSIVSDTNDVFSDVWSKLWPILDRHGIKYDWEQAWDVDTKYLRVIIKN
jgi:hypothetical protein